MKNLHLTASDKVLLEVLTATGEVFASHKSSDKPGFLALNSEGGVYFDGNFAISFPIILFPHVRVTVNGKVVYDTAPKPAKG